MQRWFPVLVAVVALTPVSAAHAQGPYRFVPTGQDDSVALRAALIQHRWVQIAGGEIRIDTPVNLEDLQGAPLEGAILEPAPGIARVRVRTAIVGNSQNPTDPSRAPFNYNGGYQPLTYTVAPAAAGATRLRVRDTAMLINDMTAGPIAPVQVGEYVCINDASRVPSLASVLPRDVRDGAMEVRRITGVVAVGGNVLEYLLDQPTRRPHQPTIAVARCAPLRRVVIRGLEFVTDPTASPRVGIHLHLAFDGLLEDISSIDWRGFSLILLDVGGRRNTVSRCTARGANVSPSFPSGWGIALEGQEDSLVMDSSVERFVTGVVINYSWATRAVNTRVSSAELVSFLVNSDGEGNPSIDSGFVRSTATGGGYGVYVGPNCQSCIADVDMHSPFVGTLVSLGSRDTRVSGQMVTPVVFGVGIELIDGGPGDGAVTSRGTYLDTLASCGPTRLALVKGSIVAPKAPVAGEGYYEIGTRFTTCAP